MYHHVFPMSTNYMNFLVMLFRKSLHIIKSLLMYITFCYGISIYLMGQILHLLYIHFWTVEKIDLVFFVDAALNLGRIKIASHVQVYISYKHICQQNFGHTIASFSLCLKGIDAFLFYNTELFLLIKFIKFCTVSLGDCKGCGLY